MWYAALQRSQPAPLFVMATDQFKPRHETTKDQRADIFLLRAKGYTFAGVEAGVLRQTAQKLLNDLGNARHLTTNQDGEESPNSTKEQSDKLTDMSEVILELQLTISLPKLL